MNNKTVELLGYNKIKEILKEYALSDIAKERIDRLEPLVDKESIEISIKETTEARAIVDKSASIPIHGLLGMKSITEKIKKGMIFSPEDLELISGLLKDIRRLKRFMKDKEYIAPTVSLYAFSCFELNEVVEEIDKCIVRGRVDDRASSSLYKTRRKILILEDKIRNKLDNILKNGKYSSYIQDSLVSQRNGRYVIPIKSEHRRNIDGSIHDKSQSGSTVFIEPAEVKKLQDELEINKFEEEKEVYRILSSLTNLIYDKEKELSINIEVMSNYDFIFAKGKYSKAIEGREVSLNTENYTNIKNGRHPLIGKSAVPLNFEIGKEYRGVVITGPNTGGKTVALKTVGLLTMMAQSGLHIPVDKGSEIGIFADILVDIGDGQSIEQSLSTFSSHIKNIINILNCADKHTLVIVDELGSGTDPGEGMGIAVAVLEELYNKGATICATTHYSEIKEFAQNREGFINGSMEFDINTLKPLYKLNIGKAGDSNAFFIALRLGMDKRLIKRAHTVTYKEEKDYSEYEKQYETIVENQEEIENHKEQIKKVEIAENKKKANKKAEHKDNFNIGDSVFVSFMNRTGIICEEENSKGEYGVMVMKKKIKVNRKRLSLHIKKDELYPEDYDLNVIFKNKEDRKKDKMMNKAHIKGLSIEVNEE
ncbi:endonuclease MutS2 [Tissierella sp. MSJ-40]|uniref:Endonuclease MutS2 n=1 Tax=Tissierella simiarum TaxID=2841534 RepID=A0ABS6E9M3_9FIRM|nr:endonuclease MutS2 [Tissierella simiarum]MBU5438909.1 endonuclease MutS2 [Tissierella simiarum]